MIQSTCSTICYSNHSSRYWYAFVRAIGTAFDYRLQYRNAHALPVASSTDTMTIVLTSLRNSYGTAWHGAESTELRDTLCSSGFSLIALGSARAHRCFISISLDGPANTSCEQTSSAYYH
jgi:hypothetical protein